MGTWMLTGESRPYDRKLGAYDRIIPRHPFDFKTGGKGAWELASRFSVIDLNDEAVRGGYLKDWTVGMNWYLNPYAKLQFNYVLALLDREPVGESQAHVFGFRAQIDF